MNATELMNTLASSGVRLALNQNGGLTASGNTATIGRYREEIRQHKPALLAALTRAPATSAEANHRGTLAEFEQGSPISHEITDAVPAPTDPVPAVPAVPAPVPVSVPAVPLVPDATEADLARAAFIRDRICSGWTWHLGQWLPPDAQKPAQGAQQAEPLPMPRLEPNRAPTSVTVGGTAIRCADCRHAVPTDHPALIDCGAGRESPAACGSWWSLDVRTCGSFEAITSIRLETAR